MSKVIIGIGSGRCGTVSLSDILNNTKNSTFTHEVKHILSWGFNKKIADKKISQIGRYKGDYVGDVAFYYLNYVEYFLSINDKIKFICLRREKDKVVESFYQIWGRKNGIIDPEWKNALPKYMWDCGRVSVGNYWELYYTKAESLKKKFPENFEIFNTGVVLNSKEGMCRMFDFVDIPVEDRRYISVRKNLREATKRIYEEDKYTVLT